MNNDTDSRVVSIRIALDLLDAVREQAHEDGRSVSGEIVSLVRAQLAQRQVRNRKPLPISGWLGHIAVPEEHAEFKAARAVISSGLLKPLRPGRRVARRKQGEQDA